MSSSARRLKEPRTEIVTLPVASLAERLRAINVPPLDEAWVQKAMRAASLGCSPDTAEWKVRLRSWVRGTETWTHFSYEGYEQKEARMYTRGDAPSFGLPIPPEVAQLVDLVRKKLPNARILVLALKSDDPWVRVCEGKEQCPIAGWYGRGTRQRLYFGT